MNLRRLAATSTFANTFLALTLVGCAGERADAPEGETSRCRDEGLEDLRRGNPAARCLPLLVMLAARSAGKVRLDLSHGVLEIAVTPC